jgi:hypothetical protein
MSLHDETDEGDIDRLGAPQLAFVEYSAYGAERWPTRSVYASASGGRDPFVDVRNPLDRVCTVDINLGCDPQLHVALERLRPKAEQLDEGQMRILLAKMAPLRPEFVRARVTWGPGETVRIPREWLPGIRIIRDGLVVSGAAPFLEIVGEKNPPLHPALYTEPEPVPPPQRRRNAK